MGLGPAKLAGHAKAENATARRIEVQERSFEVATTFEVLRSLAGTVKATVDQNHFPIVLAGSCISSVGTLAGLDCRRVAVAWFDAHADFNTPETTQSGFLDGMALAAATGRCWQELSATVDGFRPVREKDVVLIGARDLDPEERELLRDSEISWVQTTTLRERGIQTTLAHVLDELKPEHIYLHIDLDVLDISEARVNQYSSSGGLTLEELLGCIRLFTATNLLVAAAITAYDPSRDTDGRALWAGTSVIHELCGTFAST